MIGNNKYNVNPPEERAGTRMGRACLPAGRNDANKNSLSGFTLIELLVAVAVFSSMIIVVSSIFISSVGSQRKNIGQEDILDNARFVLENIGRSVRQSSIVSPAISGSGTSITINHPTKGNVVYDLSNHQVIENGIALSSSNVYVSRLNFEVSGNSIVDSTQPRVTISISLRNTAPQANEQSYINLQTTISPRNPQINQ
jgi:prepilin-type N-terminal cleavage/methylation domain-containing protein